MSFLLKNVDFSYPKTAETPQKAVLKAINQDFGAGSRVALLGPSGVGKSTLIALLGLLTSTQQFEGSIQYTDSSGTPHEYQGMPVETMERLRRREFGFALQSSYLLPHLTVMQNLSVPLGLKGIAPAERVKLARQLLERADPEMAKLADSLPRNISGGQKQRVAVLRALIHDPVVVFADEPFSALDDPNKDRILDILFNWQSKGLALENQSNRPSRTLFLVCHDPEVPRRFNASVFSMNPDFSTSLSPPADSRR